MNKVKQNNVLIYGSETDQTLEYLDSDGLTTYENSILYLKQCATFQTKAKIYKQDNIHLKNSFLHHEKLGYESSKALEEEILQERKEQYDYYKKIFDPCFFFDNPTVMYENTTGYTKKIRIIRDLNDSREEEFSENFDREKHCWFSRYCKLSRFIQGARLIIFRNRLEKILRTLRQLTPDMITKIENETGKTSQTVLQKKKL